MAHDVWVENVTGFDKPDIKFHRGLILLISWLLQGLKSIFSYLDDISNKAWRNCLLDKVFTFYFLTYKVNSCTCFLKYFLVKLDILCFALLPSTWWTIIEWNREKILIFQILLTFKLPEASFLQISFMRNWRFQWLRKLLSIYIRACNIQSF